MNSPSACSEACGRTLHVLQQGTHGGILQDQGGLVRGCSVTVEEVPTSFSPFSLVDCMLLSHFSFNDFIAVAFLDLARDLDTQI